MDTECKRAYLQGMLATDRGVARLFALASESSTPAGSSSDAAAHLVEILCLAGPSSDKTTEARFGRIAEHAEAALDALMGGQAGDRLDRADGAVGAPWPSSG